MFYFNFHSNENSSFPFRITFKPLTGASEICNTKKVQRYHCESDCHKRHFHNTSHPPDRDFFIYSLQAVTGLRHQYPFHTRGRLNRVAHRIFSGIRTSYSNCKYFFIYARTTRISPSRQNRCGGNHASKREQQYMARLIQPCITSQIRAKQMSFRKRAQEKAY